MKLTFQAISPKESHGQSVSKRKDEPKNEKMKESGMVRSQNENENEKKRKKNTFQALPLTNRSILKQEDEPKKEKKGSRTVSGQNKNEKEKKYLSSHITNGIP